MANVKLGIGISRISGSVGGHQFGQNKTGPVMGNTRKRINRPSSDNGSVKSLFHSIASQWRALSDMQRAGWNEQTVNYPLVNRLGENYTPSGYQLFTFSNNSLQQVGFPGIDDLPGPGNVSQVMITDVNIDTSAGTFTMEVSNAGLIDSGYIIQASPQVSPGMNFREDIFRFIASGDIVGPIDITTPYENTFGVSIADLSPDFRVWLRVITIDTARGLRFPSALLKVIPSFIPANTWFNTVFQYGVPLSPNGGTTATLDIGLANLQVVDVISYAPGGLPTLTNSSGVPFVFVSSIVDSSTQARITRWYRIGNQPSIFWQFTVSGTGIYAYFRMQAFRSSGIPTYTSSSSNQNASASVLNLPVINPPYSNGLFVASVGVFQTNAPFAVDSGFTISGSIGYSFGVYLANAVSYKIAASSSPESPSFTWPNGNPCVGTMSLFRA